jgi:eukaryotic-like serine/threonine-protein kinase
MSKSTTPENSAKPIDQASWQRRMALFDEACDLSADARVNWLSELSSNSPDDVVALTKMLADYDQANERKHTNLKIGGAAVEQFNAHLAAATITKTSNLARGDAIGPWQLLDKIGEGGMGEVWLAQRADKLFEGRAAIKFLRAELGSQSALLNDGQGGIVDRFLRERRLLARLTHPGIARMLDAGTHMGEPYLVMEHINGTPITSWAAAHAPRVVDRINLIIKVCRATEHAHSQLIVHRDLKPNNVLVNAAGEPSLLDFGIAKLIVEAEDDVDTQTALTRLNGRGYTLGYCAPEQITGEATSVGVDVFSIGVMLFETLIGSLPFKNEGGRAAIEHAIIHTDAPSITKALEANKINALRPIDASSARGDLEAIVAKALRKNPADRYVTVSALASDLNRWLNNQPVGARRGNWQYMTKLWLKRNKALAIVGTAAFVAVNTGLVVARLQAVRANDEAARANLEAARADSEREAAVAQRRLAEIATAQTTSALADSENAKANAIHAEKLAEQSATAARASAKLALRNEAKSRVAEGAAATASQAATTEAAKAKAVSQYLVTLFESADPERTKGDKLTLREVLDAGSKNVTAQFANYPEALAQMQTVLGKTYASLSQPKLALPLLIAASHAAESREGIRSVAYARLRYTQGLAEYDAELFADAILSFEAAMPILNAIEPATSDVMVIGTTNWAGALQKQGKLVQAEQLLSTFRAKVIAVEGEKSWAFVEVENARAVVYSGQAKFREEGEIMRSLEPLLGNPPVGRKKDALTIRNNIAVTYMRAGNYEEASRRLKAVVADSTTLLGEDAETTLRFMWFSADIFRLQGKFRECANNFAQLAALRTRASGENNALTVDAFAKTAYCAQLAGDDLQAQTMFSRARANLAATDDPPQRNVLRTLSTLLSVAQDRRDAKTLETFVPRVASLSKALGLSPLTPERYSITVAGALAKAQQGNIVDALAEIDALIQIPAFSNVPSLRGVKTYLLALDGKFDLAATELAGVRPLAKARFAANHPIHETFAYVESIVAARGNSAKAAAALATLETSAGRTARLPLAPIWFGL